MEEEGTVSLWLGTASSRETMGQALEASFSEDGDFLDSSLLFLSIEGCNGYYRIMDYKFKYQILLNIRDSESVHEELRNEAKDFIKHQSKRNS